MESRKNNRKLLIIAGSCLAVLVVVFAVIYGVFMPKGQEGAKTIGLTVTFAQDNQYRCGKPGRRLEGRKIGGRYARRIWVVY